jgi:hypothetical protein
VFGWLDPVAPINVPEANCVQLVSLFTVTFIALLHSSLAIKVVKFFPLLQLLISDEEQIALT